MERALAASWDGTAWTGSHSGDNDDDDDDGGDDDDDDDDDDEAPPQTYISHIYTAQSYTIFRFYTPPNLHDPWFTRPQIYTGRIYTNHHPQIYTPQFYTKFTQPLIYTFFQSALQSVFL